MIWMTVRVQDQSYLLWTYAVKGHLIEEKPQTVLAKLVHHVPGVYQNMRPLPAEDIGKEVSMAIVTLTLPRIGVQILHQPHLTGKDAEQILNPTPSKIKKMSN